MFTKETLWMLMCIFSFCMYGQSNFENTLKYEEGSESPKASLNDISWIQGYWKGEAFGGIVEETWTPPSGGSMMCVFKHTVNGTVTFYEIVTIAEENESLIIRLKHFNSDLKGWEEKDETVDFRLVKVTPNRVYFDGFTFEKVSDKEINMYVVIKEKEGSSEVKFNYHKQKL